MTLVKCCFCEEWRHYSSEVLLFIFMDQNLAIWDHLIPTIQSLMWSTCQYVTVRERPRLIWIWRGETTINTYIRLNPFETVWPDILPFFFSLKNQITEDWFLTLVKCCFCEEWWHCSSEVLLFIFMDQNLTIWDHLIPTIQSLMWSTCQYVTVRERSGLIWI